MAGYLQRVPIQDVEKPTAVSTPFFARRSTKVAFTTARYGSIISAVLLSARAAFAFFYHPTNMTIAGGYLSLSFGSMLLATLFDLLHRRENQSIHILPKQFNKQTVLDISKSLLAMLLILTGVGIGYYCSYLVALEALKATSIWPTLLYGIATAATGLVSTLVSCTFTTYLAILCGWNSEKSSIPAIDYIATKMIPNTFSSVLIWTSAFFLCKLFASAAAPLSVANLILPLLVAAAAFAYTLNVAESAAFKHDRFGLVAHCEETTQNVLSDADADADSDAHHRIHFRR